MQAAYSPYIARIGRAPGPMGDDYAARIAAGEAYVIGEPVRGAPVRGVIVLVAQAGYLLLDNIAVDPAVRGGGFGRALLLFAEAQARRGGYREMRLYTHEKMTENLALYARSGWVETHRAEQDGFARVFFRKTLDA